MINNCDKNPINKNNSYPAPNFINKCINDEISNCSYSTKIQMEITNAVAKNYNQYNDEINYETINSRPQLLKTESSGCDSSIISCCSEDETENDDEIENVFEYESDREQKNEIFYDSTSECEDNGNEKMNKKQNIEETINNNVEDDCGLSKLYLNDIEIDSKDEKQTVSELIKVAEKDKLLQAEESKSLCVAFGVILRLVFPLANGVVQGIRGIRDVRFLTVIRSIASSRQTLTNLFAFAANTISLNLSSVQVSHRIEPILKLLKIRKSCDGIESLPDSPTEPHAAECFTPPSTPNAKAPIFSPSLREPRYSLPNFQSIGKKLSTEEYEATKCCSLNILAQPPEGQPIRADIVFIHGLHGSMANTWKQGLWENERRPVEFQRPPKPPVRPPKRPRHSRSNAVHPAHHKKRARFAHADVHHRISQETDSIDETDENDFSYICGEPKDIQMCDGIEYSFPTFRLRMNDNGRLLQAEHDAKTQDSQNRQNNTESPEDKDDIKTDKNLNYKSLKPSANDPNYSKCWPGDWLPIDCPGVRVMAVNYTTDQHLWRPLWKKKEARSNLIQRAREMTELLIKHRVGYGHPIIWVGHSKGGLYIKQIIVDAWESGRPAAAPFWRSARGVFFYSVPHRGSHLASIKAPLLLRSVELIDIEKNNKYLLDLHRRFAGLYNLGHLKIEVFSFVETALTLMSLLYMRIVGVDSADPGIGDVCGIRLDHREICKPRSRDCILYKQLVNMINKVC